ncbi:MAG: hypothetical protein ACI9CA_000090, partial [Natronomonas sp.]
AIFAFTMQCPVTYKGIELERAETDRRRVDTAERGRVVLT